MLARRGALSIALPRRLAAADDLVDGPGVAGLHQLDREPVAREVRGHFDQSPFAGNLGGVRGHFVGHILSAQDRVDPPLTASGEIVQMGDERRAQQHVVLVRFVRQRIALVRHVPVVEQLDDLLGRRWLDFLRCPGQDGGQDHKEQRGGSNCDQDDQKRNLILVLHFSFFSYHAETRFASVWL